MKLSDLSPEEWYGRLNARRLKQRENAVKWWRYMLYEQDLVYVARIIKEQGERFPALLLPWCKLVTGTVDERLKWEAFLLADESPVDLLNEDWEANQLDEDISEAHIAAMVSGQHFIMVGEPDTGEGETPLITLEYEDQVAVEIDPRTKVPVASLKVWAEDGEGSGDELAALILPDGRTYEFRNAKVEKDGQLGSWSEKLRRNRRLPQVPVIPILCNPHRGRGMTDLLDLKSPLDGANQFATNLMAAGEHHAVARKYAIGVGQDDFVDENGNPVPLWKVAMGDVWAIPPAKQDSRSQAPQEIKVGQFSASDLRNFHESIKTMAQITSSVYGLPPSYMGYSSDNPPSAESILYATERLVLRTEKRAAWFGRAYEQAARVNYAIRGEDPNELVGLEAKWRSAATPTLASAMDAVSKGLASGAIDEEEAWVILGFSEQRKKRLRERMAARGQQTNDALRELDRVPATLPEVNGAPVLRS